MSASKREMRPLLSGQVPAWDAGGIGYLPPAVFVGSALGIGVCDQLRTHLRHRPAPRPWSNLSHHRRT
jgi:hypothetical protein